jgi:hypothetical protein
MGGNALNKTPTRRYLADEYFDLIPKIKDVLLKNRRFTCYLEVIPSYKNKKSFGDIDILYTTHGDIPLNVSDIEEMFNPNEIVRNSSVISFDFEEIQVDLIHSARKEYAYALNYMSWNDCGNLVGKLAHQLGLKHGHKGLSLPMRDGNNKFGEIILTMDHELTLKFLGLDVDVFESGFDELEDIFNFISSSKYYNPDLYKLENLNSIAKIRDRKRETYKKFLEYGERYTGEVSEKITDKDSFLPHILYYFFKWNEHKEIMDSMISNRAYKEKFNGEIVSSLTGYIGKELGDFMVFIRYKNYFSHSMVLYLKQNKINDKILEYKSKWKEETQ